MDPDGELFERLLALDHSRREPWGPLHGVVVACHRLQTATAPLPADDQLFVQLRVYLDGGLPAVSRYWAAARARNSRRGGGAPFAVPTGPLLDGPPARFAVTIRDVAVDGTFPADGHAERVHGWAVATLAAWGARTAPAEHSDQRE